MNNKEWSSGAYRMTSGQGIAVSNKYHKYVGKSGRVWLVADREDAGDYIYVTDNPQNKTGEGFGGATLEMPLVDGTYFPLKGGWHSNGDALFQDTGVDKRNNHLTFVVLANVRDSGPHYETVMKDIVYVDEKPTIGSFHRYKELIKQYPEAKYYHSESAGGSSCGCCNLVK